jgi:hypothetical protein
MRIPRRVIPSVLAVLAAALLVAACGGDKKKRDTKVPDPNPDNTVFHVGADADRFGGAAPLTVYFYSTPYHATGKVHWRWRFDDGTISEQQNPGHTFKKPGYYQVLMEARDSKGSDAWNLILGVWPNEVWEAGRVTGPAAGASLKKVQRAQENRTGLRRRQQAERSKQRAAQYSQPKSQL